VYRALLSCGGERERQVPLPLYLHRLLQHRLLQHRDRCRSLSISLSYGVLLPPSLSRLVRVGKQGVSGSGNKACQEPLETPTEQTKEASEPRLQR
jgi:hypothetical protein